MLTAYLLPNDLILTFPETEQVLFSGVEQTHFQ